MLATTILIDDVPVCVVRPTDRKALERFIRNGKSVLFSGHGTGTLSYRGANADESAFWRKAFDLHLAAGGAEEEFFGVPFR